jgi:hypothetical protein
MRRTISTLLAAALASVALAALLPAGAAAAFGLTSPDVTFLGPNGETALQAGSHPFQMDVSFGVNTVEEGGKIFPDENPKDVLSLLAPGFAANPTATPRCSGSEFATINRSLSLPACSDASAVGVVHVQIALGVGINPAEFAVPLYNLVPPPGSVLKLGFVVFNVPVTVDGSLGETFPFNAIGAATNISQAVSFFGTKLTLWGNPADPAHDEIRGSCINAAGPVKSPGEISSNGSCPVSIPEVPLLTLPTSCAGPLKTTFQADSWQHPGPPYSYEQTVETHDGPSPLGTSGCGKLGFSPQISLQPTSHSAEAPSGLDVNLDVADEGLNNPAGIAKSAIQKAEVTLPPGVTVNPSQAEGLGVCSEADLARESADSEPGQGCPNSSKIGTTEVESPLLEGEILKGSLFVAKPYENRFGSLIALYMVFRSRELGIAIKLAGKVTPDPQTGQLITSFEGLPQLPFSHFRLHFREGGRSPLVTPPTCGTYTTKAKFTPYANPAASYETSSSFQVTSGVNGAPCPVGTPPFKPGFEAGSTNNAASAYSPFYMRLTRADGEQDMTRFSSILPPGVVGKIAGLARCPQAAVEAAKARAGVLELVMPSCPAGSRIGRTLTGAGVGSELTYVPGSLYLGGPYNGDPLSVVAIVPAVAGPFDVGTVVVQVALDLNPITGEVEVDGSASDPIPHILAGIPLKVRDLRVYVDRPDFTLNPTSCERMSARATLWGGGNEVFSSADDLPVPLSVPYQASSCASLAFKPKLSLSLKGGTRRNDHPALNSVVTYPYPSGPGYANIAKAVVTLPPTQFIDNAHINNPCTRVQFNANACPPNSVLGTATAYTPLLDQPLEGLVYFRANGGERLLPDVVADLKGQFRVILIGKVKAKKGRIRTTFDEVPDAPVSKFVLRLYGGKKGLLVNSANLCKSDRRAKVELTGQNGRAYDTEPVIKTSCGKSGGQKRPAGR